MGALRSTFLLFLLALSALATYQEDADLEFDKCDLLFECYMHPRCSRTIGEDCLKKFEDLLQEPIAKRMLTDKRTGQVKLKTILLGSYLNRMG